MSRIKHIQSAKTRRDVASLLGFSAKSLSYILYKKPANSKYHQFNIPKRGGGVRIISAPASDLMNLQRRLSQFLQDCISEINETNKVTSSLSHGFRRHHSIMTNADNHKGKNYVFNTDIENFFGSINFGRVRGFFIKNKNFSLSEDVATVIAQIACHENALPQGSPCSPVISNLVSHFMDIRLAKLAHQTGCRYSRYADDLTFSTNLPEFPRDIAVPADDTEIVWRVGDQLEQIIEKSGFNLNNNKTRMQISTSRQEVTGLVVNKKVNTSEYYRRLARAMTHRLRETGSFDIKVTKLDEDGNSITENEPGTLNQLNGILSFIDSVSLYSIEKVKKHNKTKIKSINNDSKELVYRQFLFYKDFYANQMPVVLCEGKTDNIYIRGAIRKLFEKFPLLAEKSKKSDIKMKIRIYNYTKTTNRILSLNGGIGDINKFIRNYKKEYGNINAPSNKNPIIIIVDNDDGASGKGGVYNTIKDIIGNKPDGSQPYYYLGEKLYILPTPLGKDGGNTVIEDFFEEEIKSQKIKGKTFNADSKSFDSEKHYGKFIFAEKIIKRNQGKINFDGFYNILENIQTIIKEEEKR